MNKYPYRHIARVVIEAVTPLAVGSGEKSLLTDSIVARDVNGLPYIPGTSLAGIIRHELGIKEFDKSIFGFKESKKDKAERKKQAKANHKMDNIDEGSEIIFSSAQIVDADGKAVEGLISQKSDYLKNFDELPIRQHVRIDHRGTAEDGGKFDEEVVYKGTRFMFEIELLTSPPTPLQNGEGGNSVDNFNAVLAELAKETIRIGGGTRKGFGEIKIVDLKCVKFDLNKYDDLEMYINKTSSLNDPFWETSVDCFVPRNDGAHTNVIANAVKQSHNVSYTTYELRLQPDDFFLFGSGMGDDEADMTPVTEAYIDWSSGKPQFSKKAVLIPGASVKGAVAHRVAFHYNKIKGVFADEVSAAKIPDMLNKEKGYVLPYPFDSQKKGDFEELLIRSGNPAVRALFGYTSQDEREQQRGNVLISDVIQHSKADATKILNHVSIDRFTGGAIDGALFSEKVNYGKSETYTLKFHVHNKVLENKEIKQAFEAALRDIANGLLPLGGGVNRGHGCFNGTLLINGKEEPLCTDK
jgi:CRISPR/Cas system CSM-associated protein Csm3 (group 7 of RAMP superfamily)